MGRIFNEEYGFYLKKSTWESIKKIHGWKEHGAISKYARALGITRQYAELVVKQKRSVSEILMYRMVKWLNLEGECWICSAWAGVWIMLTITIRQGTVY